jgi:hypothetical protein
MLIVRGSTKENIKTFPHRKHELLFTKLSNSLIEPLKTIGKSRNNKLLGKWEDWLPLAIVANPKVVGILKGPLVA